MSNHPSRSPFLLAIVLCLVALALTGIPESAADRARSLIFDASLPGHRLLAIVRKEIIALQQRRKPETAEDSARRQLQADLKSWQQRYRTLEAHNGLLHQQLASAEREGVSPYRGSTGEPLVVPELLQATVLADKSAEAWRSGTLIDRGAADGLRESTIVLEDDAPLVDQGEAAGLEAGQAVYAGRNVVGKISAVGRWTSTIQPLTDARFRGPAQLGRRTADGIDFGSRGTLEGTGEAHCRLSLIPAAEVVSIGDEVYTAHGDATLPVPFYYGKVVEAELKPGASHWDIRVEPAVRQFDAQTVQILTRALNPLRQQAN